METPNSGHANFGRNVFKIGGCDVLFPSGRKPYGTQLSMMDKIIRSISQKEHALLESPTGTGKSLALLCGALAWQAAEKEALRKAAEADNASKAPRTKIVKNADTKVETKTDTKAEKLEIPPEPKRTLGFFKAKSMSSGSTATVKSQPAKVEVAYDSDDPDDDFKPAKKRKSDEALKKRGSEKLLNSEQSGISPPSSGTKQQPMEVEDESVQDFKSEKPKKAEKPEKSEKTEKYERAEKQTKKSMQPPKIYFGSRTHSQIAQLVRELKSTPYRPKMCVLASREHYCIHPKVSKSPFKTIECKQLVDESPRGCSFKKKDTKLSNSEEISEGGSLEVWDIEDFVSLGRSMKACPYFASHLIAADAELIFCPYNYLLDPTVRDAMHINVENAVVIIDEAHNIEDVARTSASFDFDLKNLEDVHLQTTNLLETELGKLYQPMHDIADGLLKHAAHAVENLKPTQFEQSSSVWSGQELLGVLTKMNITTETHLIMKKAWLKILEESEGTEPRLQLKANGKALFYDLFYLFGFLFADNHKFVNDYHMVVQQTARSAPDEPKTWAYTMSFWSMNPAVAFRDLKSARSIILTSGTLAPTSSFATELDCEFKHQLEASHIIQSHQIWVGNLLKGVNSEGKLVALNGSFKSSDSLIYQDSLGEVLLEHCRVIPDGVLVFFPSYSLLEKLLNRWKSTGAFRNLSAVKKVFVEPQRQKEGEFNRIMNEYYETIRKKSAEQTGGLFFAVCRGKVSEGIDFTDANCRAVIVVGVPYPLVNDLKVVLKKKHNDQKFSTDKRRLSGPAWYTQQAFRAVNQALGRCIRHANDYGAIILLDERYQQKDHVGSLSRWIRANLKGFERPEASIESLRKFFEQFPQT
eukprot:TRINITY_DN2954_c0_g2_i1.p1 TRINITY_DN2954_c0_g2~~TRINITY_DN2954_c0_g2_i1.p1  ORF type:complete len:866 (+),score=174.26 TRINITY_DN2954_c0_g2_i1:149-2746(+)